MLGGARRLLELEVLVGGRGSVGVIDMRRKEGNLPFVEIIINLRLPITKFNSIVNIYEISTIY